MYADNIFSDDPTVVQMHIDGTTNPIPVKIPETKRGIGLQVQVNAPFSGVRMGFPTWGGAGTYCTLSVSRWDTDYRTTLGAEPLLDLPVTDIQDCTHRDISFGYRLGSLTHKEEIPYSGSKVWLRLTGTPDSYMLWYSKDGKEFKQAGTGDTRYLSSETYGNFTGIMLGLWAESPAGKGYADFEYFEYR